MCTFVLTVRGVYGVVGGVSEADLGVTKDDDLRRWYGSGDGEE